VLVQTSDPLASLTDTELAFLVANLSNNAGIFDASEVEELEFVIDELEKRKSSKACYDDLIEFCCKMMPDYKVGRHHRILANELMDIANGKKDRICVNIPPRHGKSQLVSIYFPAWFLGRHPDKKVLMVSHTTDLAVDFGRKVRNLIDTPAYKQIFPTVSLAQDNKSAGRWNTNVGGEYFACGVGSALAGRGADLLLVDDPHNEQDIINGNFDVFEKAYEWFTYGARTRLMPNGRVAIIQCMVGDTPVLMGDGSERQLKDVRIGDCVATHNNGTLTTSTVLNHKSNGIDSVYAITTTCGKIVRANGRHPFLALTDGEYQWVRLKHLRPRDTLVSLRGAHDLQEQKLNLVNAHPVSRWIVTTAKTLMRPLGVWGTGGNIGTPFVPTMDVLNLRTVLGYVYHTIVRVGGAPALVGEAQIKIEKHTSNIATVSPWIYTMKCWLHKTVSALSVGNHLRKKILVLTGMENCVLTTATAAEGSVPCYVTTATSPLAMQKLVRQPLPLRNTLGFTPTQIVKIEYAGEEEVFDIQVEHTENFIANGLVSHNTRWHQDDLTGKVIRDMIQNEGSDQYERVEFPAIFNENSNEERALWPEQYTLEALKRTKASMPVFQWNAQYQQNPTAEEASVVKRDWWNVWKGEEPPQCEYIIMSLDAAAETHNRADFTALTTWGVFFNEEKDQNRHNIILLNSIKKRVEFPELKELALSEWKEWEPDAFIVEKKSAGTALYQELRRTGIPAQEYTPHRGSGDKLARLNSVADIVRSGLCWVPETRFAEEVVEEIAGFPFMSHDDLVDSTTMALMRFRQGGFIRLPSDEEDEISWFKSKKTKGYY
jgi:predicted phage terminase large subunit-like protein